MAYHVALKTPDTYRAYADECEKLANHAADIADTETKVALQLTAKAWTMLATQVEAREAAATYPILETAAQ